MAGAKMQKLNSKQVPQVILMGLVAVGLLGYVGMTLFGDTRKPASAATVQADPAKPATDASESGEAPGPNGQPQDKVSGMALPTLYNPNPFQPSKRYAVDPNNPDGTAKGKGKGQQAGGVTVTAANAVGGDSGPTFHGPGIPFVGGGLDGPLGPNGRGLEGGAAALEAPKPPARPEVVVTGIIDGGPKHDMAIVDLGSDHRILLVGDVVANNYRVKSIAMNGVWLVNGKDTFFIALGPKADASKPGA